MRVNHSIEINAPAELAWRVTVDVERWPTWSPTVTSVVRGEPGVLAAGGTGVGGDVN